MQFSDIAITIAIHLDLRNIFTRNRKFSCKSDVEMKRECFKKDSYPTFW